MVVNSGTLYHKFTYFIYPMAWIHEVDDVKTEYVK
jgi:hypothetical protein